MDPIKKRKELPVSHSFDAGLQYHRNKYRSSLEKRDELVKQAINDEFKEFNNLNELVLKAKARQQMADIKKQKKLLIVKKNTLKQRKMLTDMAATHIDNEMEEFDKKIEDLKKVLYSEEGLQKKLTQLPTSNQLELSYLKDTTNCKQC